ncbi:mannitol dehydrogenase family protein [Actinoplanes sp. NPDC048967]|uniref:mannitol dehydrogenase family protein n=1 Tax=Actinoplanes sp. NPDC048967 TaxID=3155269 RepID=UPI0033C78812
MTAPVRIVHLGLGGFFRAHQVWYTGAAPDAAGWGIAAFTGRSPELADRLAAQDGRYTLIVRGPGHDEMAVQTAVVAAHPGTDLAAWCGYLSRPEVAVVTLTVTEAGYRRDRTGGLDLDDPAVRADLDAVRTGASAVTVPGRLVAGLAARRAAGAGPLAVVSCDNLPGNGEATARVVLDLAAAADPALVPWIRDTVSFVTTMADRITPRTTPGDVQAVRERTGFADAVPVVTEPFSEWVLGGDFPGGRPAWDARFVADVKPHETRKLLLLNGGHSLLAYAGSARGHGTIAEAMADPVCRDWLAQWWDEASRHVPLPAGELADYRAALTARFTNPRIRHLLAQIAADGSQKIPIRVLPVIRGERAAGRTSAGGARVLAAWIGHLRGIGAPVDDAGAAPYRERAGSVPDLLALLAPELAGDRDLIKAIESQVPARG